MRSRLVFDGDCGFCGWTARYAARVCGAAVEFVPYQRVLDQHPGLSAEEFRAAVRYFAPGERRAHLAGAAAAFRALAHAPGYGVWWWCYRRLPGFAALTEALYRLIARHRPAAFALGRALHGTELEPARFDRIADLWTRLLGVVVVAAAASLAVQALGLMGEHGITPIDQLALQAEEALGARRWWVTPSLLWFAPTDAALQIACWAVVGCGLALAAGLRSRSLVAVAYLLWLSLLSVGQEWLSFQWDWLLLECLFCTLFVLRGESWGAWLMRLLWFRFAFLSGVVKWTSGDLSWHDLTALGFHFETQPLPAPLAWHAAQLPLLALQALTAATLMVELALPWLIFLGRRPRLLAAWGFIALQTAILASGNYNYFNLLALALTLWLFDDRALGNRSQSRFPAPGKSSLIPISLCLCLMFLGATEVWRATVQRGLPEPLEAARAALQPFALAIGYGPFAVMTRERIELTIEGSADGVDWRAYRFRYKPEAGDATLPYLAPMQPRLDWQMWFAALGPPEQSPWVGRLLLRLLEGAPEVAALFAADPFHGAAPRFVRVRQDQCWFASRDERAATGAIWHCEPRGLWFGRAELRRR